VNWLPSTWKMRPQQIDEIKSSLLKGDATSLREAAHALKGSSANMGFKQMVALTLELEMMGKTGLPDPQAGKLLFNQVIQEMRQIVSMIQTFYPS
jgi:HPt (histidine-containing phosphotransfer) domain-containing protein